MWKWDRLSSICPTSCVPTQPAHFALPFPPWALISVASCHMIPVSLYCGARVSAGTTDICQARGYHFTPTHDSLCIVRLQCCEQWRGPHPLQTPMRSAAGISPSMRLYIRSMKALGGQCCASFRGGAQPSMCALNSNISETRICSCPADILEALRHLLRSPGMRSGRRCPFQIWRAASA